MAQYVSGLSELNTVPPVTFSPFIILTITGFQICLPTGESQAWPYFHLLGSRVPCFTAPGGAWEIAPESLPAGAASGNFNVPASGLFAYGSAVDGGRCAWSVNPRASVRVPRVKRFISHSCC